MKNIEELKKELSEIYENKGTIALEQHYYSNVKAPKRPVKPYLKPNPTSTDALEYAQALQRYESEIKYYKVESEEYKEFAANIRNFCFELILKAVGYNIPKEYKTKVLNYAIFESSCFDSVEAKISNISELIFE